MRSTVAFKLLVFVLSNAFASYGQGRAARVVHASTSDLSSKATTGDADAQFDLGYLYEKGVGVPQNYRQAADYYQAAAVQGMRPPQTISLVSMNMDRE